MIASLFGILFAIAVIFAAGHGAISLLTRGVGQEEVGWWPERAALAWLIGVGYISLAIFALGFILSGVALIAAVTVGAVALYAAGRFLNRGRTDDDAPSTPLSAIERILVIILAAEGVVVLWCVSSFPLGWDGLTIWDMKAQIAFTNDGRLPSEYFRDTTRSWSHVHYPLYWPYAETWLYLCMGRVDQTWVRGLGALFYAAGAGLLAGAVPRLGGTRLTGLIAAAFLFLLPMLTARPFGFFSGYADFPLAVIYLAAVCRLPSWRTGPSAADDRLLAVLSMLAVWIKTEGKVLFGALLVSATVVVLRRGQWRRLLTIAAPATLLLVVHGAFLHHVEALPDRNYFPPTPAHVFAHLDRVGPILNAMGAQFLDWRAWSLLWPGAVLAIATLAINQVSRAVQVAAALGLPLPGYALAYLLSTWPDYDRHIHTSLSRLLLGLAPVALFAIGLAMPRFSRHATN